MDIPDLECDFDNKFYKIITLTAIATPFYFILLLLNVKKDGVCCHCLIFEVAQYFYSM